MTAAGVIARQSTVLILRERTVVLMAVLFGALVLISAWLGWQATAMVNRIYLDAAAFLAAKGAAVPGNPVLDQPALAVLRNMPVYVMLIGAMAAIVIGNRLVALDRRAGVLALIGSRPASRQDYAAGKIAALSGLVGALVALTAGVAAVTLLVLPAAQPTLATWGQFAGFFVLSAVYMMIFGLVALTAGAAATSEGVGLLVPVVLWLAVTFVLPALTLNLTPTAVLNPVSALAVPPDTAFFRWMGWGLGPVSLADAYGVASARLLGDLPPGWISRSAIPPVIGLMLVLALSLAAAGRALVALAPTAGVQDA